MKTNCPNKSHPDFKKLVEEFGELDATYAYFLNDEDIPSVDVAGKLLKKGGNYDEAFDNFKKEIELEVEIYQQSPKIYYASSGLGKSELVKQDPDKYVDLDTLAVEAVKDVIDKYVNTKTASQLLSENTEIKIAFLNKIKEAGFDKIFLGAFSDAKLSSLGLNYQKYFVPEEKNVKDIVKRVSNREENFYVIDEESYKSMYLTPFINKQNKISVPGYLSEALKNDKPIIQDNQATFAQIALMANLEEQKKLNKIIDVKLSQLLMEYLKPFGVKFEAIERVNQMGYDNRYIVDTLTKLAKYHSGEKVDENVTNAAGHLIFELIGRESALAKLIITKILRGEASYKQIKQLDFDGEIVETVRTVDKFKDAKNDLKNNANYQKEDGSLDENKVAIYVAGQIISDALKRNHPKSESFLEMIYQKVSSFLSTIFGNRNVDAIKDSIMKEAGSGVLAMANLADKKVNLNSLSLLEISDFISASVLLNKKEFLDISIPENYVHHDFEKSLKESPELNYIYNKLKKDNRFGLTGSVAFRKTGTVYRPSDEIVHDIDYSVSYELSDNYDKVIKDYFPNAIPYHGKWHDKDNNAFTVTYLIPIGDNAKVKSYDTDYKESTDATGEKDFMIGNIVMENENDKFIAVDFFVPVDNSRKIIVEEGVVRWDIPFLAKLNYARAKDLKDFRNFVMFNQNETTAFLQNDKYVFGNMEKEDYTSKPKISSSFSSPRLKPLESILTDIGSISGVTSTPANKFITGGLINEQYVLNNEVSIAELAPLFYNTIVSLKANKEKLMSMVDEGFDKMNYSEKIDYLANTSSSSLKEFLTNEAIKILNAQGKNTNEKTILSDIIGKHNDIRYVQHSKSRNVSSVKPIQGSLDKSKQTTDQQKISANFEKTDDIYDNDNPYIEVSVADFIKAGGNPIVAKGSKTITRYRLKTPIDGREFAIKRTSDLQKELVNKWKTEQEIEFQEKYYEITRVTGTALHTVMEDVIKNYLVKYDDSIFKNMIDKISKGRNFTKKDLENLQKNIYNQLIVDSSFQKDRKEFLDSPENPFKENKKSPSNSYNKLVESIIGDYIAILKIQVIKDWKVNKDLSVDKQVWNRVNVYTERRIYEDGKQDGGGTMDLVAVYSDGDYGILDYKFISAQTIKGDKTKGEESYVLNVDELQKSYMQNKERSYDAQLSSYSEVMTKVYGAKNLVFARIKPTYLQYTTNDKGKIDNNSKVSSVFTSEEAFGLIPISKERTGNKNLDAFLDRLVNQTKAIAKNLTDRKAWTTDFITLNRLTELKKITMSIQKEGDISLYTKYATMFLETMSERMENRIDSFDRAAVIETTNELDFIRYFLKNTTGIMEEYMKNFPELVDNFKADIGVILTKTNDVDSKLSEIRILRMREEANSVGIDDDTFDSYESAKDISGIQQVMLGMKSVNHVFHQTFARRVELMNAERIIFQRKIQDELSIRLEELNKWGARKGLSGSDVFIPLLNDRKDMITPWNEDFLKDMELRKDMSNYQNIKWFEDNFHRSKTSINGRPSDEDRFQKAKKNLFDKLEAAYGNQDSAKDRINNIKKEWLRKNDITHPEFIGWSYTQYKSPKNPERYYNEKYKEMMKPENKALRDFYEYSIKMNYIFRDMMGDAVDLKYNFVANIHKTMLDTLSQDGVSMTGVFSKYWNSLMNSTMNDPNDKMGDGKKEIPILFVDYVPVGDKSVDLGKSLMLFATFVNNYKHAVDLAEVYNMARRILIETPLAATDSKGNKVKSIRQIGKFEPAQALAGTESNLTKALDNYANVYAFGEDTKQDAISEFLGEKGVKRLAAVRKYVSRSSMSFNILSAAVGSLNTNLQMHSFAANGKYFTAKQVFAAEKAVVSFNAKLAFAEIFFETDPQLSETNLKAGKMSANALVKKFTNDPVYVFQRWFDKLDEKVILHCMMNNYAINPETGQVERIDKLKGKYEKDPSFVNFEWKSIWDSMEEYTNSAGEKEMRIVNQHTGKSIEPIFNQKLTGDALLDNNKNINTFMSMRRVTMNVSSRVKGTQSSEDTASWKHTVLGQVFGQFRSWMVPTVNERLKKEQYNMSMDEFEVGRWTAVYNMAGNNLLNSCKLLGKSLIPFVNQDFNSDMNIKMQEMYDLFIENNPDFANKVSFKDYLNEYKGQMRSLSREIKIFAGILLLHAALLPLLFPGDDEDDKGMIFNTISTTLGRLTTELGFYLPFTPQGATEFKKLISKDPMPLVRAIDDVGNIVKNTYDETRDLVFGEDSRRDKTPPMYYTANVFGMKNAFKYLGITDTDDKTNSIWEWLTDDSEHSKK